MLKVLVDRSPSHAAVYIYIVETDANDRIIKQAKPLDIQMEDIPEEMIELTPTFKFPLTRGAAFLEGLSKALQEIGFRDRVSNRDGEIKRLENHLEDMRTLVFKK